MSSWLWWVIVPGVFAIYVIAVWAFRRAVLASPDQPAEFILPSGRSVSLGEAREGDFYDTPELTKDGLYIKPFVPSSWQEMERYRQKRREQERERKKRQKQRRKLKGGR